MAEHPVLVIEVEGYQLTMTPHRTTSDCTRS